MYQLLGNNDVVYDISAKHKTTLVRRKKKRENFNFVDKKFSHQLMTRVAKAYGTEISNIFKLRHLRDEHWKGLVHHSIRLFTSNTHCRNLHKS